MGNIKDYGEGKFKIILRVICAESILIRDNSLEAARQYVHKRLDTELPGQYYFEVRVFPHHILRENKVLTGAGADRMQTGMAHSFGVTAGRAARVKENQEVFLVAVSGEKAKTICYDILEKIKAKFPCHIRILMEARH